MYFANSLPCPKPGGNYLSFANSLPGPKPGDKYSCILRTRYLVQSQVTNTYVFCELATKSKVRWQIRMYFANWLPGPKPCGKYLSFANSLPGPKPDDKYSCILRPRYLVQSQVTNTYVLNANLLPSPEPGDKHLCLLRTRFLIQNQVANHHVLVAKIVKHISLEALKQSKLHESLASTIWLCVCRTVGKNISTGESPGSKFLLLTR